MGPQSRADVKVTLEGRQVILHFAEVLLLGLISVT